MSRLRAKALRTVLPLLIGAIGVGWLVVRNRDATEKAALSYLEMEVRLPGTVAMKVGEESKSSMPPAKAQRFEQAAALYRSADREWWDRYEGAPYRRKELLLEERLAQQKVAEPIVDPVERLQALNRAVRAASASNRSSVR